MSAFIVEDTTINSITTFVWSHRGQNARISTDYNKDSLSFFRKFEQQVQREAKIKGQHQELEAGNVISLFHLSQGTVPPEQAFAEAMQALNIKAVDVRYSENNDQPVIRWSPCGQPLIPTLKALECWIYQCGEGDIPETSDLYKAMAYFANCMRREIISALPEYDKAEWG